MKKNTLIVNLFGGPGLGKSTIMAHIFAELKWKKYDVEMATEYAKEEVWAGSTHLLENQYFVSAEQYKRIIRLNGKLDIVITDSPLPLGIIYGHNEPEEFKSLILKYFNKFNNFNILLERKKEYNPNGRMQTEEDAKLKDKEIRDLLLLHNIPFRIMEAKRENIFAIIEAIENIKNQKFNEIN